MLIPVQDNTGTLQFLHVAEDVMFLQTDRNGSLLFYSNNDMYRPIRTVEEWARLLETAGFLRVDRGSIVNLSKDWVYDPTLRVLRLQRAEKSFVVLSGGETIW